MLLGCKLHLLMLTFGSYLIRNEWCRLDPVERGEGHSLHCASRQLRWLEVNSALKLTFTSFRKFWPHLWWSWRESPTALGRASLRRLPSLTVGRPTAYGLFLAPLGVRSLRFPGLAKCKAGGAGGNRTRDT